MKDVIDSIRLMDIGKIEEKVSKLVKKCNARGGNDNIS